MTHLNHQTNGASLEDCHTNFFALTDLCGIKWRKFLLGERPNATGDPLDDPVLRSYARCLESDILCVWRRVATPKQDPDPNGTIPFDIVTTHTHPPLSLTAAKELWIFWYGEEPNLSGLVDAELLKTTDPESSKGAWESGLSYECRSLLFKALHNLIERCLLSKDIVRLGKWFVQPCSANKRSFGKSSHHLSFSFAFFVHGESTVCASMDLREHPAVRALSPDDLAEAAAAQSSNENLTTKPVILAPFGMAATLTGNTFKAVDPATEKSLEDWSAFYPLCNKDNSDLPSLVEVISGGVKMRYPSKYVLVTDLDESEENSPKETTFQDIQLKSAVSTSTNAAAVTVPNAPTSGAITNKKATSALLPSQAPAAASKTIAVPATTPPNLAQKRELSVASKTLTTFFNTTSASIMNNFGNTTSVHVQPTAATVLPECVWQDCVTNSLSIANNANYQNEKNNLNQTSNELIDNSLSSSLVGVSSNLNSNNNNNNNNNDTKSCWDLTDPTLKSSCICSKCRTKTTGYGRVSSGQTTSTMVTTFNNQPATSSNVTASTAGFSSSNVSVGGGGGSCSTFSKTYSSTRSVKTSRFPQIPFHRRQNSYTHNADFFALKHNRLSKRTFLGQLQSTQPACSSSSSSSSAASSSDDQKSTTTAIMSKNALGGYASIITSTTTHTLAHARSNDQSTTTQGGSSYFRNPQSIGESIPIPSVGSPGSAGPSPHASSQLSQPTSVPPSDQLHSVMSPKPPTSVPNIQPPTPLEHLDKNTSSQTPTDHHDSKSITASPYVQQMPSVEPPPSTEQPASCSSVGAGEGNAGGSLPTVGNNVRNNIISGVKKIEPGLGSGNIDSRSIAGGVGGCIGNASANAVSNAATAAATVSAYVSLLKRPLLLIKDHDSSVDEDYSTHHFLYDYSTLDQWMDHPIKRFKPNDDVKPLLNRKRGRNLYEGHAHSQPPMPSPSSSLVFGGLTSYMMDNQIKTELMRCEQFEMHSSITDSKMLQSHEIKLEPNDDTKDKTLTGDLYTNEGLQVSIKDLDQLFDNSDDNSNDNDTLQVHTPPGSNKSNYGCIEEIKRSVNTNPNTGLIRNEELSKMFPTPPSHEQHPNYSPCSGGIVDLPMSDVMENIKLKQEIYPDMGSPANEPVEDWSFVFSPAPICKFFGSSKYAPLTNLPSQSLPPILLPPNTVYKPSWHQPPTPRQQQQQQQQQAQKQTPPPPPQQQQQHLPQSMHHHHHQQQQQQIQHLQQQHQLQQHNLNIHNSTNLLLNNPNNINPVLLDRERMLQQQQALAQQLSRPPSSAAIMGFGGPPAGIIQQQLVMRPRMSPISPAPGPLGLFPAGSPMNPHLIPYRRTPIPPPPPYELAVASPATSTSSYLNRQYNSQEEPATPSSSAVRSPEANALLVNVLLYDTALNIFRDHNFDSCTLCVCNADVPKCVGNIRGSDSGVYVALPGSNFNPTIANTGGSSSSTCSGSGGSTNLVNGQINRNISAFGSMDSPAYQGSSSGLSNQHQNGYVDEDPITCRCGFSAVVNRRLAHRSGLFYEDEMEITGMAEDPAIYKKKSLLAFLLSVQTTGDLSPTIDRGSNDSLLPQMVMDLLQDQCTIVQSACSSIQKSVLRYRRRMSAKALDHLLNILEFKDANDVFCLAIDQGRIAFDLNATASVSGGRLDVEQFRLQKSNISVHKWPFVLANGTRSNKDIVRIMKSMQPLLQHAFHSKCVTRLWEPTYIVKGPLTWRQFHMLAGRGTGQCEPQPIPSVVVGHEKDWLSVAPYALHYWDKLLLEPYSYPRDVAYLIIAPDNDNIVNQTKGFFKELSATYEMCKLGRHAPIKGWDGVLRVGTRTNIRDNAPLDDWFQLLGDSKLAEQIRMYANAFQNMLAPYLSRIPNDRSLLDPPEGMNSNLSNSLSNKDRPLPSPMRPPSTPDPSQPGEKQPSTPKPEVDQENQRDSLNISSSSTSPSVDPLNSSDDEINPPVIVIYAIDPFTCGTDSTDLQRVACLALLRCYSSILASIPESVRTNINFQIISLESVLELGRNRTRFRFSDEMRSLALSVFSQCRKFLMHTNNAKTLTGFGTAANLEIFLKSKDEKNRAPYKMYTPPYILAPQHEKSEKTDTFRLKSVEQQYSVMYCNYCLSEDQSLLLAAATDDRGELLETITINIDIPNRNRRRRASARRFGLQKLMDFILGIISQTVQPWRLVIGRIGRIGHSELKSWSWLLSKPNLQKASKQLKEICKQCSLLHPHMVPSILSACLVTLEPDSNLRVMPDQFTPDERFSQISMQNPLSTPQDVTCTHILVFPTSAVSQSFLKAFNETHMITESDDMIFDFDDTEDIGEVHALGEIFDWDQVAIQQSSPCRNSNQGSPGCMEDNRSRMSPGPGGINSMRNMHDGPDIEEVGQVLQQPLALGYLVSTAPTGRMPSWFWSSCPHLENVCPVFLKTALHLHVTGIQQASDDPLAQSHSSANDHPLDSPLTADVLRYVLEGYNVLSWLAMDSNTRDRLSCLPIHVQVLMQLYHMTAAMV